MFTGETLERPLPRGPHRLVHVLRTGAVEDAEHERSVDRRAIDDGVSLARDRPAVDMERMPLAGIRFRALARLVEPAVKFVETAPAEALSAV